LNSRFLKIKSTPKMFKFAAILVSRNNLLTVLKKKSSIGLMLYRPFFFFQFSGQSWIFFFKYLNEDLF